MRKKKYEFEKILDTIKYTPIVFVVSKIKKDDNFYMRILKEYRDSVWSLATALLLILLLVFTSNPAAMTVSSDNSYLSTEMSVQINVIIDENAVSDNVTE